MARGAITVEESGHSAEPQAGTFRTADGREADLFTLEHYPIYAVCQACGHAISARSFALPFEHLPQSTAQL
jgi:hypothetical protein